MAKTSSRELMRPSIETNFWDDLRVHLSVIFLLSLPLFFWQLGAWPLLDPDEGRYAEIPREMLLHHDWVTPTLNYVAYFEKPPLLYWLSAISFQIFGFHEWAARLIPALAALLGSYLVYALGRRMWSARGGLFAALILGTSLFWVIFARVLVTDMLLSTAILGALVFWWLAHTNENLHCIEKYFYNAGFWISLALAFLTKGPVALILVGGSVFFYLLICRQWRALKTMGWLWGVPLCALIVAPWFILVAQRNPQFNRFFWWGQNLARFLGIGENREHAESFFYFFQFLPVIFFPWSLFVPNAIFALRKISIFPANTPRRRAAIYSLSCALVIILFFSISTGKLVTYILPALPFLAVLMGGYFDVVLRHKNLELFPRFGVWLTGIVLTILCVTGIILGPKQLVRENVNAALAVVPCIALALWTMGIVWVNFSKNIRQLVMAMAAGLTALWLGAVPIINVIATDHTQKVLLDYIEPGLARGGEIMLLGNLKQSIGFYTRSRVRYIQDEDGIDNETRFGASLLKEEERERWFPREEPFLRKQLSSEKPIYISMRSHGAAQKLIETYKPNAVEIVRNRRHSIVGNRAAAKMTPPRNK